MSKLSQISKTAQDIAEATKAAFNVDVEIIDDNLVRVAATTFAKEKIGEKMTYGTICKYILQNNEAVIIEDTGKSDFCKNCKGLNKCGYSGGILVPINFEKEIIGCINIVIFDKEQSYKLSERQTGLTNFLYKMADLISAKLKGKELLEKEIQTSCALETIIDTVSYGLIFVDENGIIKNLNNLARNMLSSREKKALVGASILSILKDIQFDKVLEGNDINSVEICIEANGELCRYIVDIKPVIENNNVLGVVISLDYYDKLKNLALEFSNSNKQITFNDIICVSNIMNELKKKAIRFAKSNSTILITGESGTGKEMFARAIHSGSNRYNKPFIAVNCGAIPEALIESELFGYEKGAFTGANTRGKPGKFELANKGTFFLDEIGTMPIYLQTKLLRVLENREIDKIGGSSPIPIDVRIIAATNSDLEKMVEEGKFRQDLYYRLNVIPIKIPPLRKRKDDILALVNYFIKKYIVLLEKNIHCISDNTAKILQNYNWPGNVRELENVIEYAINISLKYETTLNIQSLPPYIINTSIKDEDSIDTSSSEQRFKFVSVEEYEKKAISHLLKEIGTTTEAKKEIAKKLGISNATLYRRMKCYGI